MTLSYGRKLASSMYKRRAAERRRAANTERKPRKPTSAPALRLYPDVADGGAMPGLNWRLNHSLAASLCERMQDSLFTILQLPTGTGKTATAVHALGIKQRAHGANLPFIVVAPRAVIEGCGWQRTIAAWNRDHPEDCLQPVMIEAPDRFANILAHPKTLVKTLKLLTPAGIVVLDEAHYFKTPTSKRTKQLLKLRGVHKLGLTATPFTNDAIMDGISYTVIAGMYNSKTACLRETGLDRCLDMYGSPDVYRDGTVDIGRWPAYPAFKRQLQEIVYAPSIETSSLEMPQLHTCVHQLEHDMELDARLMSVYAAARERAFESAGDIVLALSDTIATAETRVNALLELLSKPGVTQPLVFYWHNTVRACLLSSLHKAGYKPQLIAGDSSIADVDTSSDQPILVQYQSGSEGVEFKRSNTTVFYENQASASRLEQAKGRNVRRGMRHAVQHHMLVADAMFDRQVFERLQTRQELSMRMLEEIAQACIEASA